MENVGRHQNDQRKDNRGRSQRQVRNRFSLALVGAVAALSAYGFAPAPQTFDEKVSWSYLEKQLDFGVRKPGTDGHLKCRDWIQEELKKSCENVRLQPFEHVWSQNDQTVKMWNIIGEQNWKDAKTRVLLIAHWDTRPTADQEEDEANAAKPILGANDGASGVAVLLELANSLKNELPKDVGVMYLMSDGEDLGPELDEMFLGADYFAKNLPSPKPTYGILLDMIGDKDLVVPMEPNSVRYAKNLVKDLYQHAATVGLGSTFPMMSGPTIEDDHITLNDHGVPTIDLIDFDYRPWHKLSDTKDKCSPQSLGKVGKLLETWLEKDPPVPFRK